MKKKELTLMLLTLIPLLGAVNHSEAADLTSQPAAVTTPPLPAVAAPAPAPAPVVEPDASMINCQYKLSPSLKEPSQNFISTWAKKATIQSFQFNPTSIDAELLALKACFTDQGFKGFSDALDKSGNLAAIKSKQLTVKSKVTGEAMIQAKKDNQWKVKLPLEVTYENKEQKLVQQLDVDLLISRQSDGGLGIIQVIATPQKPVGQAAKT